MLNARIGSSAGVFENGVTGKGLVAVAGVARKNNVGGKPTSVELMIICIDSAPVARSPIRNGCLFWIFDRTVALEMKYFVESLRSARANVCDDMNRSGRKRASTAAFAVSSAVVSTSYASMVTGPGPFIVRVSTRSRRYALSTVWIAWVVSPVGRNVCGSESNRTMTRLSRVSPRLARKSPDSVPRPEPDITVVSTSTAPSMVTVFTLPPIGGQRTLQTPELSRFSEQDIIEANNAALANNRGSIDESFTTLFHVKGSARRRAAAALQGSRLLPFRRAYSS